MSAEPRTIALTLYVGMGGLTSGVGTDLTPADFARGRTHLLEDIIDPLSDALLSVYRDLRDRTLGVTDVVQLVAELTVDGRAKTISPERILRGDFTTGWDHVRAAYFEPMVEILIHAYGLLVQETQPGVREALEEREDIGRRLAALGMVG